MIKGRKKVETMQNTGVFELIWAGAAIVFHSKCWISHIITPPINTALVQANTPFLHAKHNNWLTLCVYSRCSDHMSHPPHAPLREMEASTANTWYRQSGMCQLRPRLT